MAFSGGHCHGNLSVHTWHTGLVTPDLQSFGAPKQMILRNGITCAPWLKVSMTVTSWQRRAWQASSTACRSNTTSACWAFVRQLPPQRLCMQMPGILQMYLSQGQVRR